MNVWQWSDNIQSLVGHSTNAHQCRNFEKMRDWAREHGVIGDSLNMTIKPTNDLPWPQDIYSDGSRSEKGSSYDIPYLGSI